MRGTYFKDATSVYGYAGLLSINIDYGFHKLFLHKDLQSFFNENRIISVFSRLNPFIGSQDVILNKIGTIENIGNVVNIDIA